MHPPATPPTGRPGVALLLAAGLHGVILCLPCSTRTPPLVTPPIIANLKNSGVSRAPPAEQPLPAIANHRAFIRTRAQSPPPVAKRQAYVTTVAPHPSQAPASPPAGRMLAAEALRQARTPQAALPTPEAPASATAVYTPRLAAALPAKPEQEQRLTGGGISIVKITRADGDHYCLQAPLEHARSQVLPALAAPVSCGSL